MAHYSHEGCGNCCQRPGLPPFWPRDEAMPPDHLVAEMQRHLEEAAGGNPCDDVRQTPPAVAWRKANLPVAPCFWLDPQTRRCRHYEFRPKICRAEDCGGENNRFL